jgi:hypothetical protein
VRSDNEFLLAPMGRVSAVYFTPKGRCNICPCYFEDRRFVIEMKSSEAGHMDLYVFLNGQLVRGMFYTVTFQPAELSACRAVIPIHSLNGDIDNLRSKRYLVNAGTPIGISLQGVDKYGNYCSKGGQLKFSDIEILGAGDYEGKLVDEESGVYKLILTLKSAGKHNILFRFKQSPIDVSFEDFVFQAELKSGKFLEVKKDSKFTIEVYPGSIYSPNTKLLYLQDSYTAGQTLSFTIKHYDRFLNETWHKDQDYEISIKNQGIEIDKIVTTDTNYCGTVVSCVPNVAGLYEISVKYNDVTVAERSVLVRPGIPYLLKCKAKGEGLADCEKRTGEDLSREIELEIYDEFGNPTTDFNVRFEASVGGRKVESEVVNISPSCFKIFYIVKETGNHEVKIWIDNTILTGFPCIIQVTRNIQEIQQELATRRYAEQKRLEGNLHSELRYQEEQRRLQELQLETHRKVQEETRAQLELQRKIERECRQEQEKLKKEQEMELEKRKRIADKIRKQQETERRAQEAIRKLEEERKSEERERKKWKRIGGGFIVPFELK